MGISVRKSMVLLLAAVLICCSYAEDHFPQVGARDRKLLFGALGKGLGKLTKQGGRGASNYYSPAGRLGPLGDPKGFARSLDPVQDQPVRPYKEPRFIPDPKLGRTRIPGSGKPYKKRVSHNWPGKKSLEDALGHEKEATEFGVKNTGENVVFWLFGKGRKAFRIGWKFGKRVYAIEKKCKKIKKFEEILGCQVVLASNQTADQDFYPTFCVIEFAKGNLKVNQCLETMGVPQQTPCTYFNGTVTDRNYKTIMVNANIKPMCSSN